MMKRETYEVEVFVKEGDAVQGGKIVAQTPETPLIMHKIMIPPGVSGTVTFAAPSGTYTVSDVIARDNRMAKGRSTKIRLFSKWPIRRPRRTRSCKPTTIPAYHGSAYY